MDKLEEYFRKGFMDDVTDRLAVDDSQTAAFTNHLKDILQRAVRGERDSFYFTPQDLGYVETFVLVGLLERTKVGDYTVYSPTPKAIDLFTLAD